MDAGEWENPLQILPGSRDIPGSMLSAAAAAATLDGNTMVNIPFTGWLKQDLSKGQLFLIRNTIKGKLYYSPIINH